jgi:hypothetical protein
MRLPVLVLFVVNEIGALCGGISSLMLLIFIYGVRGTFAYHRYGLTAASRREHSAL